jgi:uncharacterized protein
MHAVGGQPAAPSESSSSPFHRGELAIQKQLGVADRLASFARKVVRNYLTEQHQTFFRQLPFVVAASVDNYGYPAVTLLAGKPGFMHSPDPSCLQIDRTPDRTDPVLAGWTPGNPVGLLGIELLTRRRNRLNGKLTLGENGVLHVRVGQSFGNCPQYIQSRGLEFADDPAVAWQGMPETGTELDAEANAMIASAETFFVGSYIDEGKCGGRSVDASHRGGKPGFVRVVGKRLSVPDFAGNLHFNTLGNFLLNPRAGLLFVDFTTGDMLHVSGDVVLDFDSPEVRSFQGAERLWHLDVRRWIRRRAALPLRGGVGEASPNSLMTGSWAESDARLRAAEAGEEWRDYRVERIVDESSVVKSFWLVPNDGDGLLLHQAGQHLPVRLRLAGNNNFEHRVYTLSLAPSDGAYRISVRKQGFFLNYLHEAIQVGSIIQARGPRGEFVVDALEQRPLVLLAGGIGITPMLAMLRHVVYEGLRKRRIRQTWLIHGNRNEAERAFGEELNVLVAAANGAVRLTQVLSEVPEHGQKGVDYQTIGYVDLALLKSLLPFDDFDFYLCGPTPFMQSLYAQLRSIRVPDEQIHAEVFGPSGIKRDTGDVLAAPAKSAVPVLFVKSGMQTQWTPESGSLLELGEAQGLSLPYSCRSGTCGSCRQRLTQGSVTYVSAPVAHVGRDELLLCQAIPSDGSDALMIDA